MGKLIEGGGSHLLAHSPNASNSPVQIRLKPEEAWNSSQVSYGGDGTQALKPSLLPPKVYVSRKLELGAQLGLELGPSDVRPKGRLNCCTKCCPHS